MKLFLKLVGYILLAILLILLSPFFIILVSIIIFGFILFALVSHIFDLPKQKKQKAQLQKLVTETITNKHVYAYLWYDRNNELSNHLENTFIPKYKKGLIVSYGEDALSLPVAEEYVELVGLLVSYSEQCERAGASDSDNDSSPAILYTLNASNAIQKKWAAIVDWEKDEPADRINIPKTLKLFEEEMENALSQNAR
jgi:hypothetical protein